MPGSGESFGIHTPFLCGVDGSHATGMGILGSEYQWAHLERYQLRVSLTQLKRKGGRGVVGHPSPTKRESQAVWAIPGQLRGSRSSAIHVYTRGIDICWVHQVINVFLPLSGHRQFLVYTRSSTFLRLYQVIGDSLFIPGRSELFTPVAAVWGALFRPIYSRGAILGPFACVAPGRARSTSMGRFWGASFLQPSSLWDVHNGRRPFRTV